MFYEYIRIKSYSSIKAYLLPELVAGAVDTDDKVAPLARTFAAMRFMGCRCWRRMVTACAHLLDDDRGCIASIGSLRAVVDTEIVHEYHK